MSVTAESRRVGLTWEDFAHKVIGLRPDSVSSEWRHGDTASSSLLPGFEIGVTDLIPQVS